MRDETTLQSYGTQGNNVAQNNFVATINNPGPGRYKVWGSGRHSVVDGLKLVSPVSIVLASGASETVNFGPIIVDVLNSTTSITVALNVATGASDTASATIYAQKISAK